MTLTAKDYLLWVAVPYVALGMCIVGLIWRYRYDTFGWTTRSSQIYENRLLRLGSPLFHYGIVFVFLGHVIGLVIPESWTEAVGISESMYHAASFSLGAIAGVATVVGLLILIYRRRTVGPVFSATTRNDKIMYILLGLTLALGLGATLYGNLTGHPHNYREDIAPWFRSIFYFQPKPELMVNAPVGYLTRPYVVYRSRDNLNPGESKPRRGWEPVGR
ncbi:respiratory nitrate reductase subunit gamma [Nocardia tengchongensis]|uniref:respiratory nitrate reductase subunit gamma n=1 Tax=Nocardia tengchongensis TaxID=2055889 RepID=UPI0036608604